MADKVRTGRCVVCKNVVEVFYTIEFPTKNGFCSEECFGTKNAKDKASLRRLKELEQINIYGRVLNPVEDKE